MRSINTRPQPKTVTEGARGVVRGRGGSAGIRVMGALEVVWGRAKPRTAVATGRLGPGGALCNSFHF